MSLGIRFSVFSSNRVQGSGREVLGGRALVDVLEERRLLSAAPDTGLPVWRGETGAIEAALNAGVDPAAGKVGGSDLAAGDIAAVEIGGANGPQTFSAARIDDGSGRDNLHGSGAVLEWIEPANDAEESPSLVVARATVEVAGRFSSGRVLTGNMSPVATMSMPGAARVFAA